MKRRERGPGKRDEADDVPIVEGPAAFEREDAADVASRDNAVDFDDEVEDEVPPLDVVEAAEVDALLDDPESLDGEEG
ncbi:MAG: hypothetical protein ACLP81_00110 [Acidimicrobiales bacterium]